VNSRSGVESSEYNLNYFEKEKKVLREKKTYKKKLKENIA